MPRGGRKDQEKDGNEMQPVREVKQSSVYCPECGALMIYAGAVLKELPGTGDRIVVTFRCNECGHVQENIAGSNLYCA